MEKKKVYLPLLQLKQGVDSASDYVVKFRMLAAQSNWSDMLMLAIIREDLKSDFHAEPKRIRI